MTRFFLALTMGLFLFSTPVLFSTPAAADLRAEIDLSEQRIKVYVNGWLRHVWKVSTARRGYRTPTGAFRPVRLERTWYSRKYDLAPMPHSIFFYGGYAIHGTDQIRNLGRRASHGCVRLHPANAERLFYLVRLHGMQNSRIIVTP